MDDVPSIRDGPFGMSVSSSFTLYQHPRPNWVPASTVIRPTNNRGQPPLQTLVFRGPSIPLRIHPNSNCTTILRSDPIEFENLAGKPGFEATEDSLKRALLTYRGATDDPFLGQEMMDKIMDYARR